MPDVTVDALARFTPAAAIDPAEVLFRAGRASAPTPVGWKLAVAGLMLVNAVTAAVLVLRPTPDPVRVEVPAPAAEPDPYPEPAPLPPGDGGFPLRATDPEHWPGPQPVRRLPPDDPLTLLAARGLNVD